VMIEDRVVFPTHHKEEVCQVCNHCPCAILSIKAQQGVFLREVMRCEIAADGLESLTQFCSVASIARVPKRAEPLRTVGLTE